MQMTPEKRAAASEKRRATYERKREAEQQRKEEREKLKATLLQVIDDNAASSADKVKATELLMELKGYRLSR